jgi:beta-phosphoglucomutase-like phosphatase (HAD superfamily)
MFDLGDTLVRQSDKTLFPHVPSALRTLARFTDDAGGTLPLCLVSNFPQQLPVPAADLPQVFASFLHVLDEVGLTTFFQPVAQRVTISAHAGVAKPAAACFAKALERLGLDVRFDACFFITEEADHIAHVKRLGMRALQFGGHQTPSPAGTDFTDWALAPLLISRAGFPGNQDNLKAAVRDFLEATRNLTVSRVEGSGNRFEVVASARVPLPGNPLNQLTGVLVEVPVRVHVQLNERGKPIHVDGADASPDAIMEVARNVESLALTGQIAGVGESPLGPTHQIDITPKGERVLKRKRFTAF